jgi:hypothetical protein
VTVFVDSYNLHSFLKKKKQLARPFKITDSTICEISGLRREVDKNCALLDYQAASSGDCLPTFRYHFQGSRVLKDGADRLYRNVGNELLLHAAQ